MVSRSYLIEAATTMAVCSENSVVCSADSEYDMSDGAVIEYPRFNWLEAGRVAGAPHPDLNEGLRAAPRSFAAKALAVSSRCSISL